MRRIAVIGLSTFGTLLVRTLAEERCYVLAVDLNEQKINMIRDVANEAAIADARDPRALEALRLHEYDVVVLSLGEPLDASLLAALHLRDLNVRQILAKAMSEDHRRLLQRVGVADVIFPEGDMAQRTAYTLARPQLLDTLQLSEEISLIEIAPPKELVGHSLAELNLRQKYGVTVVAIRDLLRHDLRVNPDPHALITESDALLVLGKEENVQHFARER